ncbi:hypothetical protein D1007_57099 [Hordeum vulgare]|nr:hypothetical protein D1007_57099 [Hordeum vulgare]
MDDPTSGLGSSVATSDLEAMVKELGLRKENLNYVMVADDELPEEGTRWMAIAKASKVSPTLNPNISLHDDDDDDDNEDDDNDEESANITSLKIKGEMIFKSLYKNKLACSNFMEIMSIATEGKQYIEELEAHLEEHEATIDTMEDHGVITLMRPRSYLKLLKMKKPPRNLLRKPLL